MFSICVLSAHLGNFKHIDSQTPDTAGCHVWRACAWRLTAQGYLKGCANFALFSASINSVRLGGSLCDAWMLDVGQSMANMLPRCLALCFWTGCTDVRCLLWHFCLTPDSPGAAMSQFSTMTTGERKMQAAAICREVQAQEGSHIISSPLPCFLIPLISQFLSLSLVASFLCFCFLLTFSYSPHMLLLRLPFFFITRQHRHRFNTITYSAHVILRRISLAVNTISSCLTHACTGHCHIHFVEGMSPPFASGPVANPPLYDPDYK